MERFQFKLVFASIYAFCIPVVANAGDALHTLLHCKRHAEIQRVDDASVLLRSYPLGFSRIKIDPQRQNLVGTLAAKAGDALVGQIIVKRWQAAMSVDVEEDEDKKSRNIFILGQDSTPDAIAVFRGREITVFPRLLLAYPKVSLMRIRPADLIATFESQGQLDREKNDLFYDLLIREVNDQERTGRTTIQGQLADRGREQDTIELMESSGEKFVFDAIGIFEENRSEEMHRTLASKVPVYVIERFYRGMLIRFVVPWKTHGLFAFDGKLFNGLFRERLDSGSQVSKWEEVMTNWELIALKQGDTLTVTYLEAVPFFQQLAM